MNGLQENLSLSAWTTFGVGGPARYFLNAASEQDVVDGLDYAKSQNIPVFILGGGSNLLIADRGFDGLVLRIGLKGMVWEGPQLRAAAGEDWDEVAAACVHHGLGGSNVSAEFPGLREVPRFKTSGHTARRSPTSLFVFEHSIGKRNPFWNCLGRTVGLLIDQASSIRRKRIVISCCGSRMSFRSALYHM